MLFNQNFQKPAELLGKKKLKKQTNMHTHKNKKIVISSLILLQKQAI